MVRYSLILLFLLFYLDGFSQVNIIGPTEVCGDCHEFEVDSQSGTALKWEVTYPDGTVVLDQNNPLIICFDSLQLYGAYTLTATTANGLIATHVVYFWPPSSIFVGAQSTNFCNDPGNSCDQVCAGTEIQYAMEYPGQFNVVIEVTGGTLVDQGLYNFSIIWDQPGQGSILVHDPVDQCILPFYLCVEILPNPDAIIGYNQQIAPSLIEICAGSTLPLQDLSQPFGKAFWTVSDGRISTEVNPTFQFDTPGDFTVTLIENGGCNCADTTSLLVRVTTDMAPSLDCMGTVCPGEQVTYTATPGCNYIWTVSGNATILSGGTPGDETFTVLWNSGPEGLITIESAGCPGFCPTATEFRIPILETTVPIEGPASVCSGNTATYFIQPYRGTEYTWSVSPGATILQGQGTNQITVSWPEVITISTGWVEVVFDHCTQGCSGSGRKDIHITYPFHVRGPLTGCPGDALDFEALRGNFPIGCNWEVVDEQGNAVANSGGLQTSYNYIANHGSGLFTVVASQPDPAQSCNAFYRWSFRIADPIPMPDSITGPDQICPGQSFSYLGHSSRPDLQLEWTIINGGSTTQKILDQTVVTWNAGGGPWRLQLRHRLPQAPNCVSDPVILNLAALTQFDIQGDNELCIGESAQYYIGQNVGELEIDWQLTPSTAGVLQENLTNGTIEITWLESGPASLQASICGVIQNYPVMVRPLPDPMVNGPAGICVGGTASISTVDTYIQYGWYNEAGTLVSSSPTPDLGPGTWLIGVSDNVGCRDTNAFSLASYPAPEISLSSPDPMGICLANGDSGPTLFALAGNSGYQITWFFNGIQIPGATGQSLQVNDYGSYYVVVTDQNGCSSQSNSLAVFDFCGGGGICVGNCPVPSAPCPELSFTITPGAYCNVRAYDAVSSGPAITNPEWRVYDIINPGFQSIFQQTINYTFAKAGYYTLYFTGDLNGNKCELAFIDTIPVSADFSAETVCEGEMMSFSDQSTYLPAYAISGWQWNFGDPASGPNNISTLQDPDHIFTGSGTYNVTLTIQSSTGCQSTITKSVTVRAKPDLAISGPSSICEETPASFEGISSQQLIDYAWDFDDPGSGPANTSALKTGVHAFAASGTKNIQLTATDQYGCSNTAIHVLQIEANTLSGVIQYTTPICEGTQTTLHYTGMGTNLNWSHGATGNDPMVGEAGIYSLQVTDQYGCLYEPSPAIVEIVPEPGGLIRALQKNEYGVTAGVTYDFLGTCYGDAVYLGLELNGNFQVVWNTGETQKNLEFSEDRFNLLSIGTHVFTATITDPVTGCTSMIGPMTVEVNPLPATPTIAFDGNPPFCAFSGEMIRVTNEVPGLNYLWSNGQSGPNTEALEAGEYSVIAINNFGCQAESLPQILAESPSVLLAPDGCHRACAPDTLCIGTPSWLSSWEWFHDGQTLPAPGNTESVLPIVSPGAYHLVLTHANGCSATTDAVYMDLFDGISQFSGQVWFDVNNNGIIDGPDTLINGTPIQLIDPNGDTLVMTPSANGDFNFTDVPGLGEFILQLDTTLLPSGWVAVWSQSQHQITTCDEEVVFDFLLQYQCPTFTSMEDFTVCSGSAITYLGDSLYGGMTRTYNLQTVLGCDSIVTVTVTDLPGFNIAINADTSCHNKGTGSLTITVAGSPMGIFEASLDEINWEQNLLWGQLLPGIYAVSVRDENGCMVREEVSLPSWPALDFILPSPSLGCEDPGTSISPIWISGDTAALAWQWSNGSGESSVWVEQPGSLSLTVTNQCESITRSAKIDFSSDAQRPTSYFFVPNVFTPDDNGINDDFRPLPATGIVVSDYRFEVFDRWGNLLFRSDNPKEGWNGHRVADNEADQQVFVWWLTAKVSYCKDEPAEIRLKGDVTLMRQK